MSEQFGRKAIDRAIASIKPDGTLDLGFVGGEPLLEAALIEILINYAGQKAKAVGINLILSMTTNGTITNPRAWSIMILPKMSLSISCDGLPAVHDRHRRLTSGSGTSAKVLETFHLLQRAGKEFRVVMVVRPDTLDSLPSGINFLRRQGVRRIEPLLDVWADWTENDIHNLQQVIAECAQVWRAGLPSMNIVFIDR